MSNYTLRGPSRISMRVWVTVLVAALLSLNRSPARDGSAVWDAIEPPVQLTGEEHLPPTGPYIVIANHLNGPGIWVGLAAALVAHVIGAQSNSNIRGVGIAAYRDFRLWGRIPVSDRLTEILFERFYRIYDIIRMPHAGEGPGARSGATRRILGALAKGEVVILFPEGGNVRNFVMRNVQPGVGGLLRIAFKGNIPVIPVAIAPMQDSFQISIGAPLSIMHDQRREDIELLTGRAIAAMLPGALRGPYG